MGRTLGIGVGRCDEREKHGNVPSKRCVGNFEEQVWFDTEGRF